MPCNFQVCSLLPRVSAPSASMPCNFQVCSLLSQVSAPSASIPAPASNFQVCSLLPQVSAPSAAEPTHAGGTTSASSASMPLQEHRISSIQPLRLCASQGTLWRIFHAGGTTSASSESPRPVRKYGKWDCPFCTTTGRSDPNSLQGRRPRCPHWALPAQNLRGSA